MKKFASNKKVFSLIGSLRHIKKNLFKKCFRRNTARSKKQTKALKTVNLHAIDACKREFRLFLHFTLTFLIKECLSLLSAVD